MGVYSMRLKSVSIAICTQSGRNYAKCGALLLLGTHQKEKSYLAQQIMREEISTPSGMGT